MPINEVVLPVTSRGNDPADHADDAAYGAAVKRLVAVPAAPVIHVPVSDARPIARLIDASTITPKPIDWLWRGWLAAGKLHIVAGAPGCGKTNLCLSFAAAITRGSHWPDGTAAPAGDVLIWSGEDDIEDTLVPRLMACGADRHRVHFVGGVDAGGVHRSFDPAADMPALKHAIVTAGLRVRLLIVDPIVSAVANDGNKNGDVRRDLQALVDLAAEQRCAVVGVTHFSKGTSQRDPVERVTGSLAFGALSRVVMVAARIKTADGGLRHILARAKSNIGPDSGGFHYQLDRVPVSDTPGVEGQRITWLDAVDGSARELLGQAEDEGDEAKDGSQSEAVDWLRDLLADGPVDAVKVTSQAKQMGFSHHALRTAKARLGVKPAKSGFGGSGGWRWSLPAVPPGGGGQEV